MTANLTPEALRALADELKNVEAHLDRDGYSDLYAFVAQAEAALRAIADRDASLAARGFAEGVEAAAKCCDHSEKAWDDEGYDDVNVYRSAEAQYLAERIRSITPPAGCEHKEVEEAVRAEREACIGLASTFASGWLAVPEVSTAFERLADAIRARETGDAR